MKVSSGTILAYLIKNFFLNILVKIFKNCYFFLKFVLALLYFLCSKGVCCTVPAFYA
jgi:hypothetical protein